MRRLAMPGPWITAVCGVLLCLVTLPYAEQTKQRHEQLFTLPPQLLRVVSGQFRQVSADISFLNALTFIGGTATQKDTHRYLPEQYEWIYKTLQNAVTLDPYFMDPYFLMNSALIWDWYKLEEVNNLLARGADSRINDALLAFFAGFNYYYFLNDADKSVQYLKLASKRSGNTFYDTMAARIAYKMNKTELGIAYLEQQIQMAELEGSLYSLEPLKKRLEVLQGIRKIELAVEAYHKLFARYPAQIDELIKLKMLDAIPKDDLGGVYYLDDQGRVRSTKDMK
jgi:hypothetical protein